MNTALAFACQVFVNYSKPLFGIFFAISVDVKRNFWLVAAQIACVNWDVHEVCTLNY